MKINNIVIAAVMKDDSRIEYDRVVEGPPYMKIYKTNDYTLVTFKSEKCRIMGRKIASSKLPFSVKEKRLQTMSASHTFKRNINLTEATRYFRQLDYKIEYEPEIFPAMRLLDFNPICACGCHCDVGINSFKSTTYHVVTFFNLLFCLQHTIIM